MLIIMIIIIVSSVYISYLLLPIIWKVAKSAVNDFKCGDTMIAVLEIPQALLLTALLLMGLCLTTSIPYQKEVASVETIVAEVTHKETTQLHYNLYFATSTGYSGIASVDLETFASLREGDQFLVQETRISCSTLWGEAEQLEHDFTTVQRLEVVSPHQFV